MQSIAKSEEIYIVTGVAFAKEGETRLITYTTAKDDTKSVAVPNYFYKVAMKVTKSSSGTVTAASTIGFWFEHKGGAARQMMSVADIEKKTGHTFFPNVKNAPKSTYNPSDW